MVASLYSPSVKRGKLALDVAEVDSAFLFRNELQEVIFEHFSSFVKVETV
jgi:hypothetical protein